MHQNGADVRLVAPVLMRASRIGRPLIVPLVPSLAHPPLDRSRPQLARPTPTGPQSVRTLTPAGSVVLGSADNDVIGAQDVALEARYRALDAAHQRLQAWTAELEARVVAAEAAQVATVASQAAMVARADALLAVSGALVGAATPDEVARVVVERAAAALGARRGAVAFLVDGPDGPRTMLDLVASIGYSAEAIGRYRRFPLATAFPLSDVARTGEPMLLSTAEARRASYPHLARLSDENGTGAMAAVPLLAPGSAGAAPQVVGALGFNFDDARAFAPEDRALLVALAQQCAQAVERAHLYAAERAARAEAEAARQRAEEANQGKSQFLANMSHELRTPLNAIAGYVQLLDMGLHGPVTDAQHDALARVDRAQRHLLGLINDVLNYAKLESGRVEYDVRSVDLAEVLAQVSPLVEPQVAAKRLRLEIGTPDAARWMVWADREKLIQVLVNLLSNAVKFTPEGGRVRVAVVTRPAGRGARAGVAFLRVTDTGIGIARDKQEGVFEPFVQVRSGYTRAHDGTGLGLSIARDLARGMGGDLRVRSREGRGSTFTVTLRLAGRDQTDGTYHPAVPSGCTVHG